MKSYPSTFNEGGANMTVSNTTGKNNTTSSTTNYKFDIDRIRSRNLRTGSFIKQQLLNENTINLTKYDKRQSMHTLQRSNTQFTYESSLYEDPDGINGTGIMVTGSFNHDKMPSIYENPLNITASNIRSMNNYRFVYKNRLKSVVDAGKLANGVEVRVAHTAVSPSIFNPVNNVQVLGFCGNIPLLNNTTSNERNYEGDVTNCSIRKLIWASLHETSPGLGNAKYRYADFMYCKDLGKVPNNHLITLRRFPLPVGDNIFETSSPKYSNKAPYSFEQYGAMGTLVSWFGTDDNKLEDILNFNYQATWLEKTAKIEPVPSREDDPQHRGLLGLLAAAANPNYNKLVETGQAGDIYNYFGSKILPVQLVNRSDNSEVLRNYDNNKVYTPKNTVQDTHIYEGKLVFNHEFTLNFSYKLRAYDNINPKSAFVDLIGNILEVTYRRGKFWGGDRKWIGPEQNTSVWTKANAFIDNAWDKLGGLMTGMLSGSIDFGNIMSKIAGAISEGVGSFLNTGMEIGKKIINGQGGELAKQALESWKKLDKATSFSKALKGMLVGQLGRPALYAMDSLLSGDNVGVWHVTIGNPFNPIAAMGNLILTNAAISFSGPLGIDDFPSEIHVKVTLKHARGRDATEIGRMFTRGESAIYYSNAYHKLSDFYTVKGGSSSEEKAWEEARNNDTKAVSNAAYKKNVDVTVYTGKDSEGKDIELTQDKYDSLSEDERKKYTANKKTEQVDEVKSGQSWRYDQLKNDAMAEAAEMPVMGNGIYNSTAIQTSTDALMYFGQYTAIQLRQTIDEAT